MRHLVLAAGLLLAMVVPAVAQPSLTPLSDPEEPPRARPTPAEPAQLSESTASALAVGATLGGLALAVAANQTQSAPLGYVAIGALLVGPSAGHIYAGERGHAVGMTLLRTFAGVTFVYGLIEVSTVAETLGAPGPNDSTRSNGAPLMVLGAAGFVGATVYDLLDAHRAVGRANRERGFVVTPMLSNQTTGVALAGRF